MKIRKTCHVVIVIIYFFDKQWEFKILEQKFTVFLVIFVFIDFGIDLESPNIKKQSTDTYCFFYTQRKKKGKKTYIVSSILFPENKKRNILHATKRCSRVCYLTKKNQIKFSV